MTTRETLRYMLAVCGLWALTYWKRILLVVGGVIVLVMVGG